MKRIKLIFILTLVGILLIGCKNKGARVQEQLDLGSKYMAELDYESAIVALNKAIKIDPKNVDAYTMLSKLYEKSGRVDDAREILEKALDIAGLSSKKEDEIKNRLNNLEFLVMISEVLGEYDEPKAIELSNENDYDIYYSIETKENRLVAIDLKYTEPILLDEDGKYILKAYTVDGDNEKHDEIVVKYILKLAKEHIEKDSWENVGDIYRYRGKDGKIATGWLEIDGDWYYFTDNGNMATGVLNIEGKQYYFSEDGVMLTGWNEIDGKWFYFASSGEMKTDQYIDEYYVGADGVRTNIMQEPVPPSKKYTDKFGIGTSGVSRYSYNGQDLEYILSGGPVIDRGDFYEVQDTYFMTTDSDSTEGAEVTTLFITTIYIRKNAMVGLYIGDLGYEYKTAEQCYREFGGKFYRSDYSQNGVLGVHGYDELEIDEDGYFTKVNDTWFHVG